MAEKKVKALKAKAGNVSLSLRGKKAPAVLKSIAKIVVPLVAENLAEEVKPMVTKCNNSPSKYRLLLLVNGDEAKAKSLVSKGFNLFPYQGKGEIRIWGVPIRIISKEANEFTKVNKEHHVVTKLNGRGHLDLSFIFKSSSDAGAMSELAKEQGLNVRVKQKARVGEAKPGFSIVVPITSASDATSSKKKAVRRPVIKKEKTVRKKSSPSTFDEQSLIDHLKSGLKLLPSSAVMKMLLEHLPSDVGLYNTKEPFKTNGVVSINKMTVEELVS